MPVERNVSEPQLRRDPASRAAIEAISGAADALSVEGGVLYYEYPIFRDLDDVLHKSKVFFISKTHGLLLVRTSELTDRDNVTAEMLAGLDEELSQLNALIYSRLIKSRLLRKSSRKAVVEPLSLLVFSGLTPSDFVEDAVQEGEVLFSAERLRDVLENNRQPEPLTDEQWEELRSILEGTKALIRPKERVVPPEFPEGRAAILKRLENEIAIFDSRQRRAANSIVDGPQRVRGLAGSGKTVVLAMKAAHLHLNRPEARILVTFHTKSLYEFIKRLITRFYRQFSDRDPDFEDRIHVLHAWGGRNLEGVYYNASLEAGSPPISFGAARQKSDDPFEYVCASLLATKQVRQKYDYVLIDEAQDLPTSFFGLAFELAKGGETDRNIVWAYDELQSIMKVNMPDVAEMFGRTSDGRPLIDLNRAADASGLSESHDLVLHKCYRNPREILMCAHALGFGLYREVPVQMLENEQHWSDYGYEVRSGKFEKGEHVVIERPKENSPLTVSSAQNAGEIIRTYKAPDMNAEINAVVREVKGLMAQGLRPDDILIISLDDRRAREYFNAITEGLSEFTYVTNNVLANPFGGQSFTVDEEVTLSSVYRAKGNEAFVVFVLGIDAIYSERATIKGRNKIFTAFTRAKAWLHVSGVGKAAEYFFEEMTKAVELLPNFEFVYPDMSKVKQLQRDLAVNSERRSRAKDELLRINEELQLTKDDWAELLDESF